MNSLKKLKIEKEMKYELMRKNSDSIKELFTNIKKYQIIRDSLSQTVKDIKNIYYSQITEKMIANRIDLSTMQENEKNSLYNILYNDLDDNKMFNLRMRMADISEIYHQLILKTSREIKILKKHEKILVADFKQAKQNYKNEKYGKNC